MTVPRKILHCSKSRTEVAGPFTPFERKSGGTGRTLEDSGMARSVSCGHLRAFAREWAHMNETKDLHRSPRIEGYGVAVPRPVAFAMRLLRGFGFALAFSLVTAASAGAQEAPNEILGTWRMVSAEIEGEIGNVPAYGERPMGMLVFTADMHFVEVLTDGDVPAFASDARGEGTAEENAEAMARSIGFFGTYTVDAEGVFSRNRVEGSTFPNWVGAGRTRRELDLRVEGDRMSETFERPDGTRVSIVFERVG
jgi:hypothetical protein